MLTPKAIHSAEEYDAAIDELRRLEGVAGAEEAALFETWAILIDAYEAANIDASAVDPVDVIKSYMEMAGLGRADFARIVGQSRATEILNHKRALTLDMIRAISAAWDISVDLLTPAYHTYGSRRVITSVAAISQA
jgi:antitoxin component HigA of HigAB toxin-antitoxin module